MIDNQLDMLTNRYSAKRGFKDIDLLDNYVVYIDLKQVLAIAQYYRAKFEAIEIQTSNIEVKL